MPKLIGQLSYAWTFLRHPIDGFYELRYREMGGYRSATVLLLAFYACKVLELAWTHFIFNPFGLHRTSPLQVLLSTFLPFLLWVMANYLVSSITKGQGTFKAIYTASAYSLTPYVVFTLPIAVLSNVFSNAEASIYGFLRFVLTAWVGVLFYLQVKEVHGYEVIEAFSRLLWMLFAMLAIVAFAFAFFGITVQSLDFVVEFVREATGYV